MGSWIGWDYHFIWNKFSGLAMMHQKFLAEEIKWEPNETEMLVVTRYNYSDRKFCEARSSELKLFILIPAFHLTNIRV